MRWHNADANPKALDDAYDGGGRGRIDWRWCELGDSIDRVSESEDEGEGKGEGETAPFDEAITATDQASTSEHDRQPRLSCRYSCTPFDQWSVYCIVLVSDGMIRLTFEFELSVRFEELVGKRESRS